MSYVLLGWDRSAVQSILRPLVSQGAGPLMMDRGLPLKLVYPLQTLRPVASLPAPQPLVPRSKAPLSSVDPLGLGPYASLLQSLNPPLSLPCWPQPLPQWIWVLPHSRLCEPLQFLLWPSHQYLQPSLHGHLAAASVPPQLSRVSLHDPQQTRPLPSSLQRSRLR